MPTLSPSFRSSIYNDPAHWRARAARTREIAAQVRDSKDKRLLVSVAESYDRLAADAERRLADKAALLQSSHSLRRV
jgi:hypothetical protein